MLKILVQPCSEERPMPTKMTRDPAETEGFMSIAEVQTFLGGISRTTIDAMTKRGELTPAQVGGRRMITRQSVADLAARSLAKAKARTATLKGGL
jgi:hypothetical protein